MTCRLRDNNIGEQNRLGQASHSPKCVLHWPRPVVALFLFVLSLGCTHENGNPASILVVELTDANFQQEVIEAKEPVLVEFWAPWCQSCLDMEPTIERVAEQFSGRARVARIRVDENLRTASAYDVKAPPAVIVFHEGNVVKRRYGKKTHDELVALLSNTLRDGHWDKRRSP